MTWKISIQGQVQGVGFRPFVWREALRRNLSGTVSNGLQGVVLKINASEQQVIDFQQYILDNAPEMARITAHSIECIPALFFDNFTIETSANDGLPLVLLTPDVALCDTCRGEIKAPGNRRFGYAFTTCTVCGPRYSILTGLPYDRIKTTMQGFDMCETCVAEYADPGQKRYYAQTNSCADCGIQVRFFDCAPATFTKPQRFSKRITQQVITAWQSGAIVAIKGIGGYLLTCDATNPAAVANLRHRKHRPGKPFAMMYPNPESLAADAELSEAALQRLQSPAAPIVLLDIQETPKSGFDLAGIAHGLQKIGAMLPNAPLFELLLEDFGKPIVATSGNVSSAPLIFEDETACAELAGIADFILLHNRPIVMPQDDSVLALQASGKSTFLRRARGYAPTYFQAKSDFPKATTLALGAEMKSTFTISHLGNLNISQYLGDLTDFDTQKRFDTVLQHLLGLFGARPELVIGDLHPGYFTTQLGQSLSEKWQVPFLQVQHHRAHFAAVLAENELLEGGSAVLGIIWDGTGYGTDGQIWGGECFVYRPNASELMERVGHFAYFPQLLGDKMPREPRLSALAVCTGMESATERLRPKFSALEWDLYQKLRFPQNALMTSSVGRIFDAAASLLGLADKVSFEGEAAMLLEDLGRNYCKKHGYAFETAYPIEKTPNGSAFLLQTGGLIQALLQDLDAGLPVEFVAAKFHFSMVKGVQKIANELEINKIAFSGGVFQNTLLLDMMEHCLASDYQLYFHQQLSPNDENISFGQWAYAVANGSIPTQKAPNPNYTGPKYPQIPK